jgi:hypothetical protein
MNATIENDFKVTTINKEQIARNVKEYNATPLLENPEALRKKAAEDGFLFFKNILPKGKVKALRKKVLQLLDSEGMINKDYELDEAIAHEKCKELNNYGASCASNYIYAQVYKMPEFHELACLPELINIFKILFNTPDVLVHSRNIMRLMFPTKNASPTMPHQDVIYINGTKDTWTSWIPIGNAPIEIGNLTLKKGSHLDGVLDTYPCKGAGGRQCADSDGPEWIKFDYECGDLVVFGSHNVHQSVPTSRPNNIRLSVDFRFQDATKAVHPSSFEPHMGILPWEKVYEDWKGYDDLKYYWKKMRLNIDKSNAWESHAE